MEKECFYPNMERVIIKNQNLIKLNGASWLLSSLKIKTCLSKIPLVCPHLF